MIVARDPVPAARPSGNPMMQCLKRKRIHSASPALNLIVTILGVVLRLESSV